MGVISKTGNLLLSTAGDDNSRVGLFAVTSPHAGDWLNATPIIAVGLKITNKLLQRLQGFVLVPQYMHSCTSHTCPCGYPVDARGCHGLSCSRSAGRQQRPSLLNDFI